MTPKEARNAEVEAIRDKIATMLLKLEDPCRGCGETSVSHRILAAGKPVDRDICIDCRVKLPAKEEAT